MSADHSRIIPCSEYRPVVLIAQSNEEDLNAIRNAAQEFDKFDVVTTNTGKGIVDYVNQICFDAIILGLKFPDITGATVAYLVHHFDPLVSVAFLTTYKSNILVAAAEDLNLKFWDKTEKLKDLNALCQDIYDLAMEVRCDDKTRIIKRMYMQPARAEYLKYRELLIPESIAQVMSLQQGSK